jgi:FkbM family methyltransferase
MPVFLNSLKNSGHLDQIHMTVCNVGSRKIGLNDDYSSLGWGVFAPNLSIYGFDADADACEEANANIEDRKINWTEKHVPLALADSIGESTLYVTKHPMCSSLYPPNEAYLNVDIETTTLDTFCQSEGIDEIDFLQIDVQGADLNVLRGAASILQKSTLAIQIEVEFSHLYTNQPLFADVDAYLRNRDFTLFDLASSYRLRSGSPIQSTIRPGQILWADAFYFRDLIREDINLQSKTPQQIFKLACIADIMHFPDYALELLIHLTLNYGKDDPKYHFTNSIIESLSEIPELAEAGVESLPIISKLIGRLKSYTH